MEPATPKVAVRALPAFLAGLQSGLVGVLWMLAWLGISSEWQQRSFWTAENLMASAFYGPRAIRSGFAMETVSGLALYLALYSLLGGLAASVFRDRLPRLRTTLATIAFAMAWYYLSFGLLWKSVMPLVSLLHVERSTALGHLIFGLWLGRYPVYLAMPAAAPPAEAPPAEVPPPEAGEPLTPAPARSSSEPDPASRSESS